MKISRSDIAQLYEHGICVPTRTIYCGSEHHDEDGAESGVDYKMAERMLKGMAVLEAVSRRKPITIIMNNVGGDEYHGLAVYDAIKTSKCRVTIKVYGHAMSMGSIILQAADKRLMAPNARIMIHYGSWGVTDHPKIAYNWADEGKKFDKWMEDVYLSVMRKKIKRYSREDLAKRLNFDSFFNAKESVAMGLADGIIPEKPAKRGRR